MLHDQSHLGCHAIYNPSPNQIKYPRQMYRLQHIEFNHNRASRCRYLASQDSDSRWTELSHLGSGLHGRLVREGKEYKRVDDQARTALYRCDDAGPPKDGPPAYHCRRQQGHQMSRALASRVVKRAVWVLTFFLLRAPGEPVMKQ